MVNNRLLTDNTTFENEQAKQELTDYVHEIWQSYRNRYTREMEQLYTNWNAGLTKDGKTKTFDYKFDRKQTVAYADVERMIDDSLRKGSFEEIDDLYVKILNGTCRHVGHSGPNGYP